MASPFQQQALRRKLIYTGLILALFTGAFLWRHWVVDAQAKEISLREEDRGDVELSGSFVRLSLTGSRGLVTAGLWMSAMEMQRKNQWNQLELMVRTVTKLQPHFITPWLFQSWNLAYNVSVESDRVRDKYFYVTRGIQLLADGERQNHDNPDIRFWLGFYTQQKVCQSDETNVMRSLAQLSMIPPNERDPNRFRVYAPPPDRREVRWWLPDREEPYLATHPDDKRTAELARAARKEFETFCQKHPQLVRRLREGMQRDTKGEYIRQFRCETPGEVIGFLADNDRVPSLYKESPASPPNGWEARPDEQLPLSERFPALPPRPGSPQRDYPPGSPLHVYDERELDDTTPLGDDVDGYTLGRAWFSYAQEPIPDADELPGSTKPVVDRVRQHRPRNMTTLIFRHYPPLMQSNVGKRLAQEGWFDEKGWSIVDWFPRDEFSDGSKTVVGTGRRWTQDAWSRAYEMWLRHGENNHLLFNDRSGAEERTMKSKAEQFAARFPPGPDGRVPDVRPENLPDDASREAYHAMKFISEYMYYRNVSNFYHHYVDSLVESKPETVAARKCFFDAERARMTGAYQKALQTYQMPEGLDGWRDRVLLKNPEFRSDSNVQEETAEVETRYLRLYEEQYGRRLKEQLARLAPVIPLLPKVDPKTFTESLVPSPFGGLDPEGHPLIRQEARETVWGRRGGAGPRPGGTPARVPAPKTPSAKQ